MGRPCSRPAPAPWAGLGGGVVGRQQGVGHRDRPELGVGVGVADLAAGEQQWCWADQVADALVAMQQLVTDALAAGADPVDPEALGKQIQRYRSAAQIGLTQTAARSTTAMKKHHALARRVLDRQDDYLRFTTDWRIPRQQRLRTRHPHDQTQAEGVPAAYGAGSTPTGCSCGNWTSWAQA